jgi:hypothetical protein
MAIIYSYPSASSVTTADSLIGTQFEVDSGTNTTKNFSIGKIVNLIAGILEPGQQGPQGPQGPQGAPGVTGAQGVQGSAGAQGIPGPVGPAGLEWRGSWSSGTSYIADDAVGYSGASYFCILATSGTTTPNLDTTHWALLAAQGAQGPAGTAGAQGTAGTTGAQGLQGPQGAQGIQGIAGPWGSIIGNILSQTDLQSQFAVYTPTSRTITINGVTQDLASNRSWTVSGTGAVSSVFGRSGVVVATSGDYTTNLVTEGSNLYFTNARARTAISLTVAGTSGPATYNNTTGVLTIPNYATGGGGIAWLESDAVDLTVWNNGQGNVASNTSFGIYALAANTSGAQNTAIGSNALYANTVGAGNSAFGGASMTSNENGNNNTSIGYNSLVLNTNGSDNTAVGGTVLSFNTTGNRNTAIGRRTLNTISSGNNNTAVGYEAGRYSGAGSFNNVYIGATAGPAFGTTETNKLYIANSIGDPLIGGDFTEGIVTINKVLVLTPAASLPSSPVNGMITVQGTGAAQHIYCYINGAWKQLDN